MHVEISVMIVVVKRNGDVADSRVCNCKAVILRGIQLGQVA